MRVQQTGRGILNANFFRGFAHLHFKLLSISPDCFLSLCRGCAGPDPGVVNSEWSRSWLDDTRQIHLKTDLIRNMGVILFSVLEGSSTSPWRLASRVAGWFQSHRLINRNP